MRLALISVLVAITTVSCVTGPMAQYQHVDRQQARFDWLFMDKEFYACCHLRFDQEGNATDANLQFAFSESMIPAGTKVRVVESSAPRSWVTLQPVGTDRTFTLQFTYGARQGRSVDYFRRILLDADPARALADAPADVRTAIEKGKLQIGMTREQAIMARGYPPLHHTSSTEAPEWLYYYSNSQVDAVRFVDGRVDSIERGPAP